MDKNRQEEIGIHLNRVSKEISRLKKEFKENPDDFRGLENRLYWAVRGVDPQKALCKKHNRKITRNDYGEYVCGDCIEEFIHDEIAEFDENLYFDSNDEPLTKIRGIQYGNKVPLYEKRISSYEQCTGDKERILDYIHEKKVAYMRNIVADLKIDIKEAWKIIDELEAEGKVRSRIGKRYPGNKGRVCEFLKKRKVSSTNEIVFALKIPPKKVLEITNEWKPKEEFFSMI